MSQRSQVILDPRKSPVQARSTANVDAVLETTIQVLLNAGKERLTTARVALRAGVSVGTVVACLVIGTLVRLSGQGPDDRASAMRVTKPSDRNIVLARTFAAPRQKVFDALTKPDQVPRWFQPERMSLVTYEADFRAGGAFRYVFRRPSGTKIEMLGVYKEVDPPHRWVHTERYDFSPLTLLVTMVLDEVRGKTILTQTILYSSKEERDGDFDAVASSSAEIYAKLEHYLESSRSGEGAE